MLAWLKGPNSLPVHPTDFPKQCFTHNMNQKVFVEMNDTALAEKIHLNSFAGIETVKLSTFSGFSANDNLIIILSLMLLYGKFKLGDSPLKSKV